MELEFIPMSTRKYRPKDICRNGLALLFEKLKDEISKKVKFFLVKTGNRPTIRSFFMGVIYEKIIRPVLFKQDPEDAHERAIASLKLLKKSGLMLRVMERFNQTSSEQPIELFGLKFPNPVGLGAGFDKNAECWTAMAALGFGFVEVGTVTAHEQPGNQRPRMFRIPEHEALINRMGFNNEGAEAIAARLAKGPVSKKRTFPLGVNIGKSKVTTIENAAEDYLSSFHKLADHADFFTVNVSSPNTPELRKLQGADYLMDLLNALHSANQERAKKLGKPRIPMLLKIAPDLSFTEIDQVVASILDVGFDGIVATNTLVARPDYMSETLETGGLSGRPLKARAANIVKYIHQSTEGKLPIVGVGGITDVESAGAMFDAGASLVELYSGLVYRGPFFPRDVARGMAWRQREWI